MAKLNVDAELHNADWTKNESERQLHRDLAEKYENQEESLTRPPKNSDTPPIEDEPE